MRDTYTHLQELYRNTSKHSHYQVLPSALQGIMSLKDNDVKSRYEFERFDYIKNKLDLEGQCILDIGGNTGFFAFEASDAGASKVVLYEGNREHADFVKAAAGYLNKEIEVHPEYLYFNDYDFENRFDIVFLLNVLHHYGDDFGDKAMTIGVAKKMMKTAIRKMVELTDCLVLQLGFCWKGDPTKLLFEHGTKKEMIDFVQTAAEEYWHIEHIGIAEVENGKTRYVSPTSENLQRNDAIGEFRNRPLFILKSRI